MLQMIKQVSRPYKKVCKNTVYILKGGQEGTFYMQKSVHRREGAFPHSEFLLKLRHYAMVTKTAYENGSPFNEGNSP